MNALSLLRFGFFSFLLLSAFAQHVSAQMAMVPSVKIVATDPEGTELPPQFSSIDPIVFEISRTGSMERSLTVFFSLHGTATRGSDYFEVPNSISIAEGRASATLQIVPKSDLLAVVEPMETIGVRLEPSPVASPLPTYEIDGLHSEAAGVIYEQKPPTTAVLELVFPDKEASYQLGQPIHIVGATYRPEEYFRHIDFYDNDHKIGSSDVTIDVPPAQKAPVLAFHEFLWKEAAVGEHKLTAVPRARMARN